MTELQKALNKKDLRVIEAVKIVREAPVNTVEDAKLVADIFAQAYENKTLSQFIEGREQVIKVYSGMRRIKVERGEDIGSIEKSLEKWDKELKKAIKADKILRLHKVVYGGE